MKENIVKPNVMFSIKTNIRHGSTLFYKIANSTASYTQSTKLAVIQKQLVDERLRKKLDS